MKKERNYRTIKYLIQLSEEMIRILLLFSLLAIGSSSCKRDYSCLCIVNGEVDKYPGLNSGETRQSLSRTDCENPKSIWPLHDSSTTCKWIAD